MGIFDLFRKRKPVAPVSNEPKPTIEQAKELSNSGKDLAGAFKDFSDAVIDGMRKSAKNSDRKVEPGKYKPKSAVVRVSNVARAAGVSAAIVREFAKSIDVQIFYNSDEKHALMHRWDAERVHKAIWKIVWYEKA